MHLKLIKLLLFSAVFGATAYLGNAVWRQYIVPARQGEEPKREENALKPEQNLIPQENAVFVDEQQIAGSNITIRAVAILDDGYLTVTPKFSSEILGSSTILKTGVYKNLSLKIGDIPAGDNNLVANLYLNNGQIAAKKEFLVKKVKPPKPEDLSAPYAPRDVSIDVTLTDYEIIPKTIKVNLGDRVTLNINNRHIDYETIIPEFGVSAKIPAGQKTLITFTAKEAGIFRVFCPQKCEPYSVNSRSSIEVIYKKLNLSS